MNSKAVERRLAAILAADVVGYSRLMGEDEAGTLARLNAHRKSLIDPAISGHQGRIVKTTGDGLLAEFASVVDAVRCAIHIQSGMAEREADTPEDRKMLLRIGINLGDVIVEGDDIFGDGVNVAARIEALADPGGVYLSGDAFRQIRNKLDVGFEDLGEKRVKNIAEPVSVYRVLTDAAAGSVVRASPRRKRWLSSGGAVAAALVAAALVWNFALRQSLPTVEAASMEMMAFPLPDKPSIVVLPFDNLSGDPEQQYFADGLTDDVITALSKLSGLFVISRNTAFAYRGEEVSVKRVAEELGVRYVLDGSIRRSSDQVRINAQLVDATTGETLWAERFDGDTNDIFALQDDINARIVSAMAVELTAPEQQTVVAGGVRDARAYDAFLKGAELLRRNTAADTGEAVKFLHQAIEYDPDYSQAYAALAAAYWTGAQNGWLIELGAASVEAAQTEARGMLEHAMQVSPTAEAFALEAEMAMMDGKQDRAVEMAAHSLEMSPSRSDHQARLGKALTMAGRPDEALGHLEQAARRNPRGHYLAQLGLARFVMGDYEKASALFERQLESNPWHVGVAAPLAAAYAHLGREDEARAALKRLVEGVQKARGPEAEPRISAVVSQFAFSRPEDRERLAEGLRKAGLPE